MDSSHSFFPISLIFVAHYKQKKTNKEYYESGKVALMTKEKWGSMYFVSRGDYC